MNNSFGDKIRVTTFGASHSKAIGGVLDGFPAGMEVDYSYIEKDLKRRKTGAFFFSSQRDEEDEVIFLSGIDDGYTTGFPIAFYIKNNDARSNDYNQIKSKIRPSHADFTYFKKYGITDFSGGGRYSGRETTSWVVAGSLAKQLLAKRGIEFFSYISQIGDVIEHHNYWDLDLSQIDKNPIPTPDASKAIEMMNTLRSAYEQKDSLGGVVRCIIKGVPAGVGNPLFNKLSSRLASAMLTIPSAKGFDYGLGFDAAYKKGSENNDVFESKNGKISTATNRNGGILGGISNGEDIYFRVAFKPVSSIGIAQQTVDIEGNAQTIEIKGRHDTCILPRVLPVVEALSALVVLDLMQC